MTKRGLPTYNCYNYNAMFGETIPLAVTQTSTSQVFALTASINNYDVMITNLGPSTTFINFGNSTKGAVIATTPGTTGTNGATPILSGAIYTFQKNTDGSFADTVAAICPGTGTATVYFTSIQGS